MNKKELRKAMEEDGVKFISIRWRAIKLLFQIALKIDPDIFLFLCRYISKPKYEDEIKVDDE